MSRTPASLTIARRAELLRHAGELSSSGFADPEVARQFDATMDEIESLGAQEPGVDSAAARRRSSIAERWAKLAFPLLMLDGGRGFEGFRGASRLLDGRPLLPGDLAGLEQQLDALEAHQERVASQRLPEWPPTSDPTAFDPRQAKFDEANAETERIAKFRGTDAGRLETLITQNERILELLGALQHRG